MNTIWYNMVSYVDWFLSLWLESSAWFLLSFFWFIIILLLSIIFFKISKKQILKFKERLIYQYDNIFYIISKYDYQTSGKWSLNIMKNIFTLKKPSYLSNHKLINTTLKQLESDLWQNIISEEIWSKIKTLHKRVWFNWFVNKLFKFISIVSIISFVLVIIYFYK